MIANISEVLNISHVMAAQVLSVNRWSSAKAIENWLSSSHSTSAMDRTTEEASLLQHDCVSLSKLLRMQRRTPSATVERATTFAFSRDTSDKDGGQSSHDSPALISEGAVCLGCSIRYEDTSDLWSLACYHFYCQRCWTAHFDSFHCRDASSSAASMFCCPCVATLHTDRNLTTNQPVVSVACNSLVTADFVSRVSGDLEAANQFSLASLRYSFY